jgi:hypothetical protein
MTTYPCCNAIGDILIRRENDKIRILKADPRTAVVDELWNTNNFGYLQHHDGVITIRDDFGTQYIYRDLGHCYLHQWHIIEWPD